MLAAVHPGQEPQSAAAVLMVRPAGFGFNPQTAASNAFQRSPAAPGDWQAQHQVLLEFDGVVAALGAAGVEVLVALDTPEPVKPDAIFPNNWVSFHQDGSLVLYPMLAPNRRLERREEILGKLLREAGFHVSRTVDLTHRETEEKFLEGTGSLVLDRTHRIAYACVSARTDLDVLGEFAQLLDYDLMTFDAVDASGRAVYHTNVLMAVGSGFAVLCGESISEASQRAAVFARLRATGHAVVDISLAQMAAFAGNMLELAPPKGPIIALSTTALASLDNGQRGVLEAHARLLPVSIPTIERLGGGGVRCMLAEVHLPKR
jgi:hypothetical protein